MEQVETEEKRVLHLFIKPTFEGASEMTDATSDEAILYMIGFETQETDVEIGKEFEVPRKCEAEYEETIRIYSEEDGDLYDPFDPPTSLKSGRYMFEGEAIRVLDLYDDNAEV